MPSDKVVIDRKRRKAVLVFTAIHNNAADSTSQPIVIQCLSALSGIAIVMKAMAMAI